MQVSAFAELILLRALLPTPGGAVSLQPGSVVTARVLDRGLLALAGGRVPARLPDDVQPGQVLHLRVQEAAPDRVTLQIVPQPPPVPATTAAVPLPGGAYARIIEDDQAAGRGGSGSGRAVVLRYDSPTLGRLDIHLSSAGATVYATAGEPADMARAAAGDLALALGAPVAVLARTSALDARA